MILGGRRASDKEFRAPIAAILVCKQHAENVLGGKGNSTCSFFIGRGGSVFGRGYALRSLELAEGFAGDPEDQELLGRGIVLGRNTSADG